MWRTAWKRPPPYFWVLTLGCTRCYYHKYDPFKQKEFYQLFAYFNNLPEKSKAEEMQDFTAGDPSARCRCPPLCR